MGNHFVGKAIGLAAEVALSNRKPGDTALSLLDAVCRGHEGCDAEFEAEDPANPGRIHPEINDYCDPHPNAALGMLMLEAFAPNGVADISKYAPMLISNHPDGENATDLWRDEVCIPFSKRYGFC